MSNTSRYPGEYENLILATSTNESQANESKSHIGLRVNGHVKKNREDDSDSENSLEKHIDDNLKLNTDDGPIDLMSSSSLSPMSDDIKNSR